MRGRSLSAALATATLAAATLTSAALAGAGSAHAIPVGPPRTLVGSSPSWVRRSIPRGSVAAAAPVTAQVYLAPRGGEAALDAFVAAVSTPGTSGYGDFLSAAQYHARFDPSRAEVRAVATQLAAHGLRVTGVERFDTYLTVRGTGAAADAAFGTTLRRYSRAGALVEAPATDLQLPAGIGSEVLGVTGLDTALVTKQPTSVTTAPSTPVRATPVRATAMRATAMLPTPTLPPPDSGYQNGTPCSQFSGQLAATRTGNYTTKLPVFAHRRLSYSVCGYVPSQLRGAYGIENSRTGAIAHDGHGQTIAVVDAYASQTMLADANEYSVRHGEPTFARGQFTQSLPARYTSIGSCGASGWYGEETLDVEAAHAMAPGAGIHYYGSASCNDPDFQQTLRQVVDDDDASIVSNSWAGLEYQEDAGAVVAYESVFKQGAAQGIGFDFSSGDDGDEVDDGGFRAVDYPSSDPYVTAVGGTATGVGAAGTRSFQAGWGTEEYSLTKKGTWVRPTYLYGSGGGYSSLFPRPAYQFGVVPGADPGARSLPDLSADADPSTGMLIGQTQTFGHTVRYGEYRIGGTSLASPLTAGMLADVQQGLGSRIGLANPLVYSLARRSSRAFTDVKPRTRANLFPPAVVRVDFTDQKAFSPAKGYTYTVRTFGQDGTLKVTRGWDDVTGVGTPNVPAFIAAARALRR